MNYKKLFLGSVFLIMSGVIYEIDKVLSYYKWSSYIIAISGNGGYNLYPDKISLTDNWFVLLFLIIGFIFYFDVALSFFNNKKK